MILKPHRIRPRKLWNSYKTAHLSMEPMNLCESILPVISFWRKNKTSVPDSYYAMQCNCSKHRSRILVMKSLANVTSKISHGVGLCEKPHTHKLFFNKLQLNSYGVPPTAGSPSVISNVSLTMEPV